MSEPSRSRRPRVSVREVVDSLDEPMRRRGFERRNPFMAEATADDHWVASWLRMPPDDQVRDAVWPDGESIKVGFYDGVSVWSDGWVSVGPGGNAMHAKLEWRNSPLDADEFACVVVAIIDQWDRFIPHTGPPLRREGWTRG